MSGSNAISVYKGNTLVVTCTITPVPGVLESLNGYTSTLTVKESVEGDAVIENTPGGINGMVITHTIPASDNDIDVRGYLYEITIVNGNIKYSVRQDSYTIKKSIKF